MKQCVFVVQRRDDTRWHVCEAGMRRSLASFGFKEDAVEYARDLARAWTPQPDGQGAEASDFGKSAGAQEATQIGARAAASLAAGTIKKPAMSRA